MKQSILKLKVLIILIIAVGYTSCSSSDSSDDNTQTVFRFDVDGVTKDYSNDLVSATLFNDGRELSISAIPLQSGPVTEFLRLKIGEVTSDNVVTEGLYTIGNSSGLINENIIYRGNTSSEPFIELYGPGSAYACDVLSNTIVAQINLMDLDVTNRFVSGTFSGTLFQLETNGSITTIEITNGVFTIVSLGTADKDIDDNSVNATVSGLDYVSNSAVALRSQSNGDHIRVTAFDHNFGRIIMVIPTSVTAGNSYALNNDNTDGVFFFNFLTRLPDEVLGSSGITITQHDTDLNIIEGSFYVENASTDITNAVFSVSYQDNFD